MKQPVIAVLESIVQSVEFCCGFCAVESKPIAVVVTVICEDGLHHIYERHV